MALNFGLLDQGGPTNFFEGYSQGQEKMQANAMAQQRAAQAQQEFGMRQQEFAAGQAEKKRLSTAAIVTQRTLAARDAILNARTPDQARAIERAQHADEYLGPIRRQFGSLEADLADIPDEPTAFEQWKEKQAMGATEFLKRQASNREFATAVNGAPQTNAMGGAPAAPAPTAMAAAAPVVVAAAPMFQPSTPRPMPKVGDSYPYTYMSGPKEGTTETRIVTQTDLDQARDYRGSTVQLPSDLTAMPAPVANAMAPQAPAVVTNAMASAPAPAAAPIGELERLTAQRNNLSRIRPENPGDIAKLKNTLNGIDKQIEVLNRQEPDAVRIARAIAATVAPLGTAKNLAAYNKALGEQTDKSKDKVNIIGVAKGTGNPVYLDLISDEQYVYVADADGKQKRKLYSGPVDRSTSNVSQSVSNKVDAFVPASEAAQTEFMKEARVTYSALKNAQPTLDNIEAAKALIPTAKGFMGAGGEPLLAAASFLNNRLGTKIDTQGVTDANVLRSRLFFGILENLKKLDSQPSQSQQAALQEALGSLGTDPNALGRVLDAFGDSIRAKVDSHNTEMSDAETRGIKFPYNPRIVIKPKSGATNNPHAGKTNEQIKKELGL